MKLMKKTVAFVLMSLLATGMIACDQKKEKAEVAPAQKAASVVEPQAPAAEVQAPAAEEQAPAAAAEGQAPVEEVMPPAEEGQQVEIPSPDVVPQGEEQPQAPAAGAPSQH
jgi:hypothetical protein